MTGHILIADAISTNRITLKVRLSAACYQVSTESDPGRLAARLRSERPDLVILGSGIGADLTGHCQRLRQDPHGARVPVLALTRSENRLAALRAGASAVIDPQADDMMLLARIRGLLRDADHRADAPGMAESQAAFDAGAAVTLVADTPARALCWKHLLAARLPHGFVIADPEAALGSVARGRASDLYLIAADIRRSGDGLRLMSELRARSQSRHAAFVIATGDSTAPTAAIALDLGAGEVLPMNFGGAAGADSAALAIGAQLARKQRGDAMRAQMARSVTWAMTDPLTGLYNRRYALPQLADRLAHGGGCAVLAMDLDRFKQVNDRFGHAAGDAVLRETAARIADVCGVDATVVRMGGEEFLAILPSDDDAAAWRLAESLRRAIQSRPVPLPSGARAPAIDVTMSIGIAVMRHGREALRMARATADVATGTELAEWLLDRADRAMMRAKTTGRNRAILADSEYAA